MTVEIKQFPDHTASAIGLEKHNRSKLPGTFDLLFPSRGVDNRWLTGIDEDALSINSIQDPETKQRIKEDVRKRREDLEKLTNLDLSATNHDYWKTYKILLNQTTETLNFSNPFDKLKYYVLIANNFAAPDMASMNSPQYMYTKYYISRKEEESKTRVVSRKTKDEARAKLLEISKDEDKLVLIAKYLLGSRKVKKGMDANIVYEDVSAFLDDPKEKRNVSLFLEATKKTVEELQYKLTVDEALRTGIIKIREGYYQRGNATYGKSIQDAIDYLSSVENSGEFASLKDEVENYV